MPGNLTLCVAAFDELTDCYLLQTTARQAALLAACMGFCALQQLQLSAEPASLDTVAAEEEALFAVCSILAVRGILVLQRGAFVRLALGRFSHSLLILKSLSPGRSSSYSCMVNVIFCF